MLSESDFPEKCPIFNKITQETPGYKIAILFHGCAGRSCKYTWESTKLNLIDVLLENGFNVDVFMHTWLHKGSFKSFHGSQGDPHARRASAVDDESKYINNTDYKLIPCKKVIAEYQEDVPLPKNVGNNIRGFFDNNNNIKSGQLNTFMYFIRLFITLDKVTNLMVDENIEYDAVFIIVSDLFFPKKLNIKEVYDVIKNKNVFYNTIIDWQPRNGADGAARCPNRNHPIYGIGDSYILTSMKIAKIYGHRFSYIKELVDKNDLITAWWLGFDCSYIPSLRLATGFAEYHLGYALNYPEFIWKDSSMIYIKTRANRILSWHKTPVLKKLTAEELQYFNKWKIKHDIKD